MGTSPASGRPARRPSGRRPRIQHGVGDLGRAETVGSSPHSAADDPREAWQTRVMRWPPTNSARSHQCEPMWRTPGTRRRCARRRASCRPRGGAASPAGTCRGSGAGRRSHPAGRARALRGPSGSTGRRGQNPVPAIATRTTSSPSHSNAGESAEPLARTAWCEEIYMLTVTESPGAKCEWILTIPASARSLFFGRFRHVHERPETGLTSDSMVPPPNFSGATPRVRE